MPDRKFQESRRDHYRGRMEDVTPGLREHYRGLYEGMDWALGASPEEIRRRWWSYRKKAHSPPEDDHPTYESGFEASVFDCFWSIYYWGYEWT